MTQHYARGVLKLMYVVGALLLCRWWGHCLWGALGGTHQSYRLEGGDELNRLTARVGYRECGNKAETSEGMLPEGRWFTVTKKEMVASRGKPTCPNCLRPDLVKLEGRKLWDE